MWFYVKFVTVLILAVVLKYVNVWIGAIYAFCVVFGFGCYAIFNEYGKFRITKDNIWDILKWIIYGLIAAILLCISGGDDANVNDYMEYLEPR